MGKVVVIVEADNTETKDLRREVEKFIPGNISLKLGVTLRDDVWVNILPEEADE